MQRVRLETKSKPEEPKKVEIQVVPEAKPLPKPGPRFPGQMDAPSPDSEEDPPEIMKGYKLANTRVVRGITFKRRETNLRTLDAWVVPLSNGVLLELQCRHPIPGWSLFSTAITGSHFVFGTSPTFSDDVSAVDYALTQLTHVRKALIALKQISSESK